MQAHERVRADHVKLPRFGIAQIFGRFLPFGHGRAVGQVHFLDGGRIHLDAARGRVQRVFGRIGPKIPVTYPAVRGCGGRQRDFAFFPERLERHQFGGRAVLVGGLHIIHWLLAFGEADLHAAQVGQPPEDLEIVQCIALRCDDLLHRVELVDVVGTTRGNVIAFQRGGGRQHDVGPVGGGRPPAVLHDHGVHFLQRPDQFVEILLVRQEIVAGVVDQLDQWIGVAAAVVGECLARVVEHLADA